MLIENVNIGLDHSRVQNNLAPFFVNWTQDGINNYEFFWLRSSCERMKDLLTKTQNQKFNKYEQ